ncbi:Hint domain-containing protein [Roseivivax jejudonensis]|nr:Hint domain-containing protein [Roseivivax jejudonensis]
MRRYEAAALGPDLTIRQVSVTAPAIPVFEEATSAFARGTLVRTVGGPVAIEDLLPGDYVETDRGSEPVVWIGSTSYVPGVECEGSGLTRLTRVVADAMGPSRPATDLVTGPGARMVVESQRLRTLIGQSRVLVSVADFADGDRFLEIHPAGAVELYHIALRRHATIRVGGIEMETYHPGTGIRRQLGDYAERFARLFPHVDGFEDFGDLSLPRSSRSVLDSIEMR